MTWNLRPLFLSSLSSLVAAGCISAANVDAPGGSMGGDDTGSQGGGISATGGRSSNVTVGSTGGVRVVSTGGAAATSSSTGGAQVTSVGGTGATVSGGSATAATGGSPASTTPAPTNSLGVYLASVKGNTGSIEFEMRVDNMASQSVDLSNVTIRYWYQDEGLGTILTFATYYISVSTVTFAGKAVAAQNLISGADHYFELSLTGALKAKGDSNQGDQLILKFAAHTSGYQGNVDITNDYSYNAGSVGYDDKITLYSAGTLIWGTEPGGSVVPLGTGGASSFGGASSAGGSSSTGGAAGGETGSPGGVTSTGGVSAVAGDTSSGGTSNVGGNTTNGGASNVGGASSIGGDSSPGGDTSVGGATNVGGDTSIGGDSSPGGDTSIGGNSSAAGASS